MYKKVYTLLICLSLGYAGDIKQHSLSEVIPIEKKDTTHLYIGLFSGIMKLTDHYTDEYFQTIPIGIQVGYDINRYFSLEGRYIKDVGKVSYDAGKTPNADNHNFDTTFSNLALFIKPKYTYKAYSVYALLGYGRVLLSDIKGADRSEDGFEWGVGTAYSINRHFSFFIDYISAYDNKGFGGRATDRTVSVDNLSLGVSYVF